MPSAARQKLPPELWRYGKSSNSSSGLVNSYGSFGEMQVSPGQYDIVPEEKQQYHNHSYKKACNKSQKRHYQGRKSPKTLACKGSGSGAISDPEMENFERRFAAKLSPSSSVQSDSGINYTTQSTTGDVYALESWPAPDPNELPFPPLEWLQQSSGKTSPVSSDLCNIDLRKILACIPMV